MSLEPLIVTHADTQTHTQKYCMEDQQETCDANIEYKHFCIETN